MSPNQGSGSGISIARLQEIAASFGLSPTARFVSIGTHQTGTRCYEIGTERGRFCLKLSFTAHAAARVEATLRIQRALAESGAPCASPIARGGKLHLRLPEGVAALWHWIDGVHLCQSSPETMTQIGRLAALLHSEFQPVVGTEWPPPMPTLSGLLNSILCEVRYHACREASTLLEVIDHLNSDFTGPPARAAGLIHGDLHHHNILATRGGDLVLIDFDNCEFAPFSKDIGTALYFVVDQAPDESTTRAFRILDAYDSVQPLSAPELHHTAYYMRRKGLVLLGWLLLRFLRGGVSRNQVLSAARCALATEGIVPAVAEYPDSRSPLDWKQVISAFPCKFGGAVRRLLDTENIHDAAARSY